MSFVDVGQAAQEAAIRAQQEAVRKAAEEAARKAAEEAARKAAEEVAAKQAAKAAQVGDTLVSSAPAKKAITSRLTAYEVAEGPPPAAAAPEAASGVPARFGFGGTGNLVGEAVSLVKDLAADAQAGATAVEKLAGAIGDPVASAARAEVEKATDQAIAESAQAVDTAGEAQQKAENAQVPLDAEDRRVTEDFNEQELQAYKELSAQDRDKFNDTYQYLHCIGQNGRETEASKGARDGFRKALVEGRLLDADKDGVTVLDHFKNRIRTDLAPALEGKRVDTRGQLQTLAYQIGYPGKVFQGADNNTCVAASLQAQMAARDPGEYMRVSTGLIFDGKVTLNGPNGPEEMTLDTGALWSDEGEAYKTRATTNQLIQQSFMTFAREKYPAQEGDVLFTGGRYGRGGQYGGGEDGLTLNQAEQLFENVAGTYVTPVGVTAENRGAATGALEQAVQDNRRIQVGLASDRGGHMVGVIGIETDAAGNKTVRYSDSNDGEEKTLPLDRFMELATGMVLPSQYAGEFVGATTAGASADYGGGRAGRGGGVGG